MRLQHLMTLGVYGCIGCGYVWVTMDDSQRGCKEVLNTMRLMESLKSQMLYSQSLSPVVPRRKLVVIPSLKSPITSGCEWHQTSQLILGKVVCQNVLTIWCLGFRSANCSI